MAKKTTTNVTKKEKAVVWEACKAGLFGLNHDGQPTICEEATAYLTVGYDPLKWGEFTQEKLMNWWADLAEVLQDWGIINKPELVADEDFEFGGSTYWLPSDLRDAALRWYYPKSLLVWGCKEFLKNGAKK